MENSMETFELLDMTTNIGYWMLVHGAEIYRVEESIQRMAAAYGINEIDVFAIPSSLVVSIAQPDGHALTKTKRVLVHDLDFDKVDLLNNLSRQVCRECPGYQWVKQEMQAICNRPVYSFACQVFHFSLISFAFTLFFGGNFRDALFSIGMGALLKLLLSILSRFQSGVFFTNLTGSFMVAVLAVLGVNISLADNMDKMIIGTLMNLVPGIGVTNSMRDFIAGDLIAGMIKLAEAILIATGIAVGVTLPLAYLRPILEAML